jgi:hypothetical protein
VAATEFAGLISNAVGMAGVAEKFEKDKAREGVICFLCGVVAQIIMQPLLPFS